MIVTIEGKSPVVDSSAFVEETARLIGDVSIGAHSSVWYYSVLRGDIHYIKIGSHSNIQDQVIVHVTEHTNPTIIGDYVTVGHRAMLHGCTIKDHCLIGIGSVILDGAVIEEYSLVAAGTVIPPNAKFPPYSLILGLPGKFLRKISQKDVEMIDAHAIDYVTLKDKYR
jgi:carbonic anhydrase/acetyltransferase-like protein (isoleucine patch superfamily)